jgi:GTP cyclohydrolase FolE2
MDFDFFFKMVCTISFAGVTLCLCIKWIVESYLDYIQVMTGIRVLTHNQLKDMEHKEREDIDDDPTAY